MPEFCRSSGIIAAYWGHERGMFVSVKFGIVFLNCDPVSGYGTCFCDLSGGL